MKRREFLQLGAAAGVATILMGSKLPFLGVRNAYAATQTLEITITDAMKQMVTHNNINDARCYFWIYEMKADGVAIPPDCPGPTIYAVKGDTITITGITNTLDEPHSFFIPGNLPGDPPIFDSGTSSSRCCATPSAAATWRAASISRAWTCPYRIVSP